MVQTVQVQPNGNAPSGLGIGDIVRTQGGDYIIATPGAPGASYNPDNDYWSVRLDSDQGAIEAASASARDMARANSELSQEFAREQMRFQEEQNAKAMAFNAEEAQKNRDWQQMMSSTAHQREVADLVAAGLNPILSANSGAAMGSGATASGVTSAGASGSVDNSAAQSRLNTILQLAQMKNQMDMTKISAAVGLQQAQLSAGAMAYSAQMAAMASMYGVDENIKFQSSHPNSLWSLIGGAMSDFAGAMTGDLSNLGPAGNAGVGLAYLIKALQAVSGKGSK